MNILSKSLSLFNFKDIYCSLNISLMTLISTCIVLMKLLVKGMYNCFNIINRNCSEMNQQDIFIVYDNIAVNGREWNITYEKLDPDGIFSLTSNALKCVEGILEIKNLTNQIMILTNYECN